MKIATFAVLVASTLTLAIPSFAEAGTMRHHNSHRHMMMHSHHHTHMMGGNRGKMAAHRNF